MMFSFKILLPYFLEILPHLSRYCFQCVRAVLGLSDAVVVTLNLLSYNL